ncbi:hypothetical protein [Acidocella sp.]|uniref:hypothetical protein n=1 Tax=Acidocella sp. TaxID=50710 RepID=UPI003D060BAB
MPETLHSEGMDAEHDPRLMRLFRVLPSTVRHSYEWLIRPQAKWVRIPVGVALMLGGIFSFLPVLGIWMLPLGAILVGEDIPPIRRATLHGLGWVQKKWDHWQAWRTSRKSKTKP